MCTVHRNGSLSFRPTVCVSFVNFIPLVIQVYTGQGIGKDTCDALICVHLILSVLALFEHVCLSGEGGLPFVQYDLSPCRSAAPLQRVAWLVCSVCLVSAAAAVWQSGLLLPRKAYVSQTGQAVQGSHQNELLIRSDTNRSYRHQSVRCKSCLKIIRNVCCNKVHC